LSACRFWKEKRLAVATSRRLVKLRQLLLRRSRNGNRTWSEAMRRPRVSTVLDSSGHGTGGKEDGRTHEAGLGFGIGRYMYFYLSEETVV
jgi:hypothetical protein